MSFVACVAYAAWHCLAWPSMATLARSLPCDHPLCFVCDSTLLSTIDIWDSRR